MSIKIAIIGAGSIGFTQKLIYDLLAVPELADTIFHLMDISQQNLAMITELVKRTIAANKLPAIIESTLNQREAIVDCDYVISVVRQGGLEAFKTDIDIPLKYGIDQCVGDTICAGGIMYAQRTIPVLLDICRDIRAVAKSGCLFLNYTNPMAMEAAVSGDVTLVKQAMLHDPLVGAVCNTEEVWQMTDEMLVAQAQWLPQYGEAIPAAQARLAEAEANGTRVKLSNSNGAVRLPMFNLCSRISQN